MEQYVKETQKIKVQPLVRNMLYLNFKGTKFTKIGLQNELLAVDEYIENKRKLNENAKVQKMGLIVNSERPFLAARPDGKVVCQSGECGLIEI